ncbi:MAG TPA: DUF6491 family protein [Rhizomicrobium sp.]|jgi:hypothetical protein
MVTGLERAALAFAVFWATLVSANAQPDSHKRACFPINEMRGWKAADSHTLYIRVDPDRIFRLDLAAACPMLMMPTSHLITNVRGSDLVCSAVDWDLAVSEPPPAAMPEHCIVKQMTLLAPAEAAAIPPKFTPR